MRNVTFKLQARRSPEWWIYRTTLWMFALLGAIDLLTSGAIWQ